MRDLSQNAPRFDVSPLGPRDRAKLQEEAAKADVSVDAFALGVIGAYLTLLRDAAAVLPARPLSVPVSIAHRLDAQGARS
jgi:hypothetical protein